MDMDMVYEEHRRFSPLIELPIQPYHKDNRPHAKSRLLALYSFPKEDDSIKKQSSAIKVG